MWDIFVCSSAFNYIHKHRKSHIHFFSSINPYYIDSELFDSCSSDSLKDVSTDHNAAFHAIKPQSTKTLGTLKKSFCSFWSSVLPGWTADQVEDDDLPPLFGAAEGTLWLCLCRRSIVVCCFTRKRLSELLCGQMQTTSQNHEP